MEARTALESEKHPTRSCMAGRINELRHGMEAAIENREKPATPRVLGTVCAAWEAVLPCAGVLLDDFVHRGVTAETVFDVGEGKRLQPRGFKMEQVMATTQDSLFKHIYGINGDRRPAVWRVVEE